MSSAPLTSTSTAPTREVTRTTAPDSRPRAARSSGCMSRWWRGRPLVSRLVLCSQELQSCLCRRPMSSSSPSSGVAVASAAARTRSRSATTSGGRQVDPLVGGLQALGHRRAQRAEVDALGVLAQRLHRRPAAGLEQAGDDGGRARREPGLGGEPVLEPDARTRLEPLGEVPEDLPVVPGVVRLGEHRGREAGGVADREAVEDQVVLVPLERRGRRQDDVGVPGRLVEVDVDRDHEVERRRAPGPAPAPSGVDSTGLPAMVTIARIWPSPGVSISSRITAAGSSPANSGMSRTRLRHTSWWPGPDDPAPDRVDGRLREQHAALAVEVAGQQVEQLDRPLAHRPEARAWTRPSGRTPPRTRPRRSRAPAAGWSPAGTPLARGGAARG